MDNYFFLREIVTPNSGVEGNESDTVFLRNLSFRSPALSWMILISSGAGSENL